MQNKRGNPYWGRNNFWEASQLEPLGNLEGNGQFCPDGPAEKLKDHLHNRPQRKVKQVHSFARKQI